MLDENEDCHVKYNTGDVLAVTIKPDDKFQGNFQKESGPLRALGFYQLYSDKLKRLMTTKDFGYWFSLELSEPIGPHVTNEPRFHLHGIIMLKTRLGVFKWLSEVIPDLLIHAILGIKHIKDVEMEKGWHKYCEKQSTYIPTNMRKIMSGIPMIDNHPCYYCELRDRDCVPVDEEAPPSGV